MEEIVFACSISLPALPYSLFAKRESFLFIIPPLDEEEGDRLRWRR